jgi:hypothetical protein
MNCDEECDVEYGLCYLNIYDDNVLVRLSYVWYVYIHAYIQIMT